MSVSDLKEALTIDLNKEMDNNISEDMMQLVSFTIGSEEFGVNIQSVKEINRIVDITRVPNSPSYVEGVINLRGKVIPIIDLRRRLKMENVEQDKSTRIIVLEIEGKIIGFIVDSVKEVISIDKKICEPPPKMASEIENDFITEIARLDDRLLILLNMKRIVQNSNLNAANVEEEKQI